jgi:polyisoprenoid-binding protein YceI
MTRTRFLIAVSLLAATAAGASTPKQAQVQYLLDAGGKHIEGASRELEWSMVVLTDGSLAVHLLVPMDSLASNDAEFDAALRKAIDSHGQPFLEVLGIARRGRFEGTLRVGDVRKPVSLAVETTREDGVVAATVKTTVDPTLCGIVVPGLGANTALTVTFRVAASGNAVLAGGSTRYVN